MPSPPSEPGTPPAAPGVRRVADVQLRGRAGPVPARAYWPASASAAPPQDPLAPASAAPPAARPRDTPPRDALAPASAAPPAAPPLDPLASGSAAPPAAPPLLVLLPAAGGRPGVEQADGRARDLAARLGVVVLSVGYRPPPDGAAAVDDAAVATRWAGDHAAELGAAPGPLVVVAEGPGAAPAVAAARLARDEGWPRVARLVLVGPEPDGDPLDAALAGLPAVVTAAADGDLAVLLNRGGEGVR